MDIGPCMIEAGLVYAGIMCDIRCEYSTMRPLVVTFHKMPGHRRTQK